MINCDDWNSADEIQVCMCYAWYRDYINSTITPKERLERYGLDFDKNSPDWAYPAEEFESYVTQYFDVSTEYLRNNDNIYQADKNVYRLSGGGTNIAYGTKVESKEDVDIKDGYLTICVSCSLLGNFSDTICKILTADVSDEKIKFKSCVTVQ